MKTKKRYTFTAEEIKKLKKSYGVKTNEYAMELWAESEFDLRHNASLTIGKNGRFFIEIQEID